MSDLSNNSKNTIKSQLIIFGIGSNLGERQKNINDAIKALTQKLNLNQVKSSSIYQNPAVLPPDAPESWNIEFFNIALSAIIDRNHYQPLQILQIIKEIEKTIGRVERPRWAPREIDIDILLLGNEVFVHESLQIPHREFFKRDFFIKTSMEIESDFITKNFNLSKVI